MANGLWTEARAALLNVTRLEPDDPHAWIYAAVALQESGQPEAGFQELQLARDRFPGFPPAHYRFGDPALRAGHLDQARDAFTRLTRLAVEPPLRIRGTNPRSTP